MSDAHQHLGFCEVPLASGENAGHRAAAWTGLLKPVVFASAPRPLPRCQRCPHISQLSAGVVLTLPSVRRAGRRTVVPSVSADGPGGPCPAARGAWGSPPSAVWLARRLASHGAVLWTGRSCRLDSKMRVLSWSDVFWDWEAFSCPHMSLVKRLSLSAPEGCGSVVDAVRSQARAPC